MEQETGKGLGVTCGKEAAGWIQSFEPRPPAQRLASWGVP